MFIMKRKMLVIDVDERIRKFNSSAYSVLLNVKYFLYSIGGMYVRVKKK